tara:strand:- start:644 stop:2716 length:2073 start_codon:yes stop_codon:yes gene_type:complete
MSIYKSYFKKNNTIIAETDINTGRNPVTQLFYGKNTSKCKFTGLSGDTCNGRTGHTETSNNGYSRFIFDLDLDDLRAKAESCCLQLSACTYVGSSNNQATFSLCFTALTNYNVGALLDWNFINITDTVGLSHTYAIISGGTGVAGTPFTLMGNPLLEVPFSTATTLNNLATNFCAAVNSSSGHGGSILCTTYNGCANLTQTFSGASGNLPVYISCGAGGCAGGLTSGLDTLTSNSFSADSSTDILYSAFTGGGLVWPMCDGEAGETRTFLNNVGHTLRMTNTSNFDDTLINQNVLLNDTRRATSFTLMLYKTPGTFVFANNIISTGSTVLWDEGVGYDYLIPTVTLEPDYNSTQSKRPSNWNNANTLDSWPVNGTYNNMVATDYTVLATQHFPLGNENIAFSSNTLNAEINNQLVSPQTGITYGIAYLPSFELLTGLTEAYSVGFFTRHTQTFYEPYLETTFNDTINDDRGNFNIGCKNRLFLYVYDCDGNPICLDDLPVANIFDCTGQGVGSITGTALTCGAYYVDYTVSTLPQIPPVEYRDMWTNIFVDGIAQPNVTNYFIIQGTGPTIGTTALEPVVYGYSVSGLKENEKIIAGDIRKVFISARVPYTSNQKALVDNIKYRLYVLQGTTQVEVIGWTSVNRTFTNNYFLLDTGWMIPNEYYVDIKATSNQQVDTYSKAIKFQIVNQL